MLTCLPRHLLLPSHSRKANKGVAIELLHFIGDGIFKIANDVSK